MKKLLELLRRWIFWRRPQVVAQGNGQRVRGKTPGSRPKVIVCDEIIDENSLMCSNAVDFPSCKSASEALDAIQWAEQQIQERMAIPAGFPVLQEDTLASRYKVWCEDSAQ